MIYGISALLCFAIVPCVADEFDESRILERILAGERDCYAELIEHHEALVFKIVGAHIPRDQVAEVAQDVFVIAYQSLRSYRQENAFSHWLSKITVRRVYDFWRKQRRSREIPAGNLSLRNKEQIENTLSRAAHERFTRGEEDAAARELLQIGLASLGAKERLALSLVYLDGYKLREAAELLGWSVVNTKVQLHRAKKKLIKCLRKQLESEND